MDLAMLQMSEVASSSSAPKVKLSEFRQKLMDADDAALGEDMSVGSGSTSLLKKKKSKRPRKTEDGLEEGSLDEGSVIPYRIIIQTRQEMPLVKLMFFVMASQLEYSLCSSMPCLCKAR